MRKVYEKALDHGKNFSFFLRLFCELRERSEQKEKSFRKNPSAREKKVGFSPVSGF